MNQIVKKSGFMFQNAIVVKKEIDPERWGEYLTELSLEITMSNNYRVSPFGFYQKGREFDFFCSLGYPPRANDIKGIEIVEHYGGQNYLMTRHSDLQTPVEKAYEAIEEYAKKNDIQLEEGFYHILLDVYGETIVDVYAKIVEEKK
jgi:hypothetical protein